MRRGRRAQIAPALHPIKLGVEHRGAPRPPRPVALDDHPVKHARAPPAVQHDLKRSLAPDLGGQ